MRNWNNFILLVGAHIDTTALERNMTSSKRNKDIHTHDAEILFLAVHPGESLAHTHQETYRRMVMTEFSY